VIATTAESTSSSSIIRSPSESLAIESQGERLLRAGADWLGRTAGGAGNQAGKAWRAIAGLLIVNPLDRTRSAPEIRAIIFDSIETVFMSGFRTRQKEICFRKMNPKLTQRLKQKRLFLIP